MVDFNATITNDFGRVLQTQVRVLSLREGSLVVDFRTEAALSVAEVERKLLRNSSALAVTLAAYRGAGGNETRLEVSKVSPVDDGVVDSPADCTIAPFFLCSAVGIALTVVVCAGIFAVMMFCLCLCLRIREGDAEKPANDHDNDDLVLTLVARDEDDNDTFDL